MDMDVDSSEPERLHRTYSAKYAFASLNKFRKNKEFCDVSIEVNNVEYPAHRIVLAAFSSVFKGMFSGEYADSRVQKIRLNCLENNAMESILSYAYCASAEITAGNAVAVLNGANFLQAWPLFNKCCDVLASHPPVESCLHILKLTAGSSHSSLKEKAKKCALANFAKVCEEREFLDIETETLEDIVKDDSLNAQSEEIVFDAVMRWLYHKEEERAETLERILRYVRLAQLDADFLNDRASEIKYIWKSKECMRLVDAAKNYLLFPNRRMELQSSVTRTRNNSTIMEMSPWRSSIKYVPQIRPERKPCLTIFGQFPLLRRRYNPEQQRELSENCQANALSPDGFAGRTSWTTPYGNQYRYLVPSNFNILVHTREYSALWRRSLENLDAFSRTCPIDMSGPKRRDNIVFSELDGTWYAIGGQCLDGSACRTVERLSSGVWSQVAPLLEAVYSPAVVSLRGYIYVIGGFRHMKQRSIKVQRYYPRRNIWEEIPPLPENIRCFSPACALDRQIYVFSETQEVHVYDVSTEEWGLCAKMTYACASGPVILNGNIYVISSKSQKENVIERYSPASNAWRVFKNYVGEKPLLLKGPYLRRR